MTSLTFRNAIVYDYLISSTLFWYLRTVSKFESFDFVTSRAVANLRILLELNIPAIKVNGCFLVMKAQVEEELEDSKNTMQVLSCKIIRQEEFNLPKNVGTRTLLNIQKTKETDQKYPRTYDKIKKKALK